VLSIDGRDLQNVKWWRCSRDQLAELVRDMMVKTTRQQRETKNEGMGRCCRITGDGRLRMHAGGILRPEERNAASDLDE